VNLRMLASQDPASDGAAASNKEITLELASQISQLGGDGSQALEAGTFAPGEAGDPTAAGNTCDDADDTEGCIFTQNLLVEDATQDEIDAVVAGNGTTGGSAANNGGNANSGGDASSSGGSSGTSTTAKNNSGSATSSATTSTSTGAADSADPCDTTGATTTNDGTTGSSKTSTTTTGSASGSSAGSGGDLQTFTGSRMFFPCQLHL
jgi:hypothetical protein